MTKARREHFENLTYPSRARLTAWRMRTSYTCLVVNPARIRSRFFFQRTILARRIGSVMKSQENGWISRRTKHWCRFSRDEFTLVADVDSTTVFMAVISFPAEKSGCNSGIAFPDLDCALNGVAIRDGNDGGCNIGIGKISEYEEWVGEGYSSVFKNGAEFRELSSVKSEFCTFCIDVLSSVRTGVAFDEGGSRFGSQMGDTPNECTHCSNSRSSVGPES